MCVDTVTVEHLAHKDKEKLGDFPSTTYLPLTGIKARPVHMVSPVADFAGCMQVDDQISSVNPWIYGGCFNFSMPSDGCLGKLKVGSVVYFGSVQGGEMVLDTVFVVGGFYDTDKMTKEKVSKTTSWVTFKPLLLLTSRSVTRCLGARGSKLTIEEGWGKDGMR